MDVCLILVNLLNLFDSGFIGAFSKVRCGLNIGDNSVVAMDTLVLEDVKDWEIVGGVPQKHIKKAKKLV